MRCVSKAGAYLCDKHPSNVTKPAPTRGGRLAQSLKGVKTTAQNRRRQPEPVVEAPEPKRAPRARQKASPVVIRHNPSVPLAFQAKKVLEPEGWQVKAEAFDEDATVVLTGSRGKEIISLTWVNGKLTKQDYSMFVGDKPELEGMPRPRLDFIVDDMSDMALVKELCGKKVTWWNRIGKSKETATFPARSDQRVKVEHLMNGSGHEEKRVISFVDQSGTGYRAFDAAALLSVR